MDFFEAWFLSTSGQSALKYMLKYFSLSALPRIFFIMAISGLVMGFQGKVEGFPLCGVASPASG